MSERAKSHFYATAIVIATIGLYAALAIAGSGCDDKKAGLGGLNAVIEARNAAVRAGREADALKKKEFGERYDAVQNDPMLPASEQQARLDAIDKERAEHKKNVEASQDFLEAFGKALAVAKKAVIDGQPLLSLLPPLLDAAANAERGLRALGVNANFVKLLTGGK